MSGFFRLAAALGFAFAIAGGASSAQAAALPTSVSTIKSAVAGNTITVQRRWGGGGARWGGGGYRGGRWGGYGYRGGYGWGWGWPYYGAGFAIGAAPYYYGYPAYGYPAYYDAPVYQAAPPPATRSGAVRQCWVETDSRGYGYWRPC